MRLNTTLWHVRGLLTRGHVFRDADDMIRYTLRACGDPIFHRRTRRCRQPVEPEPVPANVILYRSDGAARGQGNDETVKSGAGVVVYDQAPSVQAWVSVSLGNVSKNVAEYTGAIIALERTDRLPRQDCVLQMDSMLVTNQLLGQWRVLTSDLRPLYRQANAVLQRLQRRGSQVSIQHIYREFNKDADAKANLGADGVNSQHNW